MKTDRSQGRKSQVSAGVWLLQSCPCTTVNSSSINKTQWKIYAEAREGQDFLYLRYRTMKLSTNKEKDFKQKEIHKDGIFLKIMCMSEYGFVHTSTVSMQLRIGHQIPWSWSCRCLWAAWSMNQNLGLLQEQDTLLITKPSLCSPRLYLQTAIWAPGT